MSCCPHCPRHEHNLAVAHARIAELEATVGQLAVRLAACSEVLGRAAERRPDIVAPPPVIHYAPYISFASSRFTCGAPVADALFTDRAAAVTCLGCMAASPGLWPLAERMPPPLPGIRHLAELDGDPTE